MAQIIPRPGKGERKDRPTTWQVVISLPQQPGGEKYPREYHTFHGTKTEAQAFADAREVEVKAKGKHYIRPSKLRVSECAEKWYQNHVLVNLKAKTQRSYEQNLRLYILPHLGHMHLTDLTPQTLTDWVAMLARPKDDSGHGLGPRSVELAMTTLNRVLEERYRLGELTENPLDRVQKPKQKPKVVKSYELDDLDRIEVATQGRRLRFLFQFLWQTGLRISEAIPLTWDDVDWDEGMLFVSHSLEDVKGKRVEDTTKSEAGIRPISLTRHTVELLRQQKALIEEENHRRGWAENNLVFPSLTGTPLYQSNIAKVWAKVKAKAGVAKYGVHSLRHTSASLLLLADVSMREIAESLGHKDPGFTSRTYVHLLKETRRRTATKLEALFDAEEEKRGRAPSPEEPV